MLLQAAFMTSGHSQQLMALTHLLAAPKLPACQHIPQLKSAIALSAGLARSFGITSHTSKQASVFVICQGPIMQK